MLAVLDFLSTIEDSRDQEKVIYPIATLLFISICAIFCGAEGWEDIVVFAESRKTWLENYVDLSNVVSLATLPLGAYLQSLALMFGTN